MFKVFFSIYNIKALSLLLKKGLSICMYFCTKCLWWRYNYYGYFYFLSLAWSIDIFNRARHSQYENEAKRYRHIELRRRIVRSILKEPFFIFETVTIFQSLQVNNWKGLKIGAYIYLYIKWSKDCVIIVICFSWCLTTRTED